MSRFVSFAALLAAGFAAAAFAAPQNTPTPNQQAASSTAAKQSPIKPGDRNCIRDTGSLIPAKKGECLPVAGRSYTKHDLDNTGERTLGPALEKLDPSITVRGGGR
ncbi:hypothetical protein GCM10007862_20200 [Dyella lipolytica]|uniref:Uncharacterized protein n=1 Tax=Dyella lipolytica TaxID=1867835 RepID=A0ABW8IS50_9GAMM|nr:hypothetical protein [Dyella lipolytica]GLQ46969.1 hypothetical protein GCM10007862_20200 [Dyella lipolytica]